MSYPDYLIHFNKNHSNKNGQFTSGDGDGDGIRDDHHNYAKNKWAIKRGYQNKDGSLTSSGKYNVNAYKDYKKKVKAADQEANKLLKSSKKLRDLVDLDFDTYDDILGTAESLGLDTKVFEKTISAFDNQDVKAIQNGSVIVDKMRDIVI